MNDRFKFRAWYCDKDDENDPDNNKMFYNAQDAYDCLGGNPPLGASSFGDIIDDECWVVEQCTGLKDKNGKLIYENDIVKKEFKNKPFSSKAKTKEKLIKIRWNDVEACFSFDFLNEKDKHDDFQCWESVWGHKYSNDEVIGNIHENADLLEYEE